jgi:hypothetical protein
MSCALAVAAPKAPERARTATAARRAGVEFVDIRLIPLCNAMVRRDSDTGPDESAGWGGQVPPCPTPVAGPSRRIVGEFHLVRGWFVLLIWERLQPSDHSRVPYQTRYRSVTFAMLPIGNTQVK